MVELITVASTQQPEGAVPATAFAGVVALASRAGGPPSVRGPRFLTEAPLRARVVITAPPAEDPGVTTIITQRRPAIIRPIIKLLKGPQALVGPLAPSRQVGFIPLVRPRPRPA